MLGVVQPENLVLDEQFNIKIVDFGLASYNPEGAGHVMHSGVGSQPYSAPEIFYSKELYQGQGYKVALSVSHHRILVRTFLSAAYRVDRLIFGAAR